MCVEPARRGRRPVERPLITAVKQKRGGEKEKKKDCASEDQRSFTKFYKTDEKFSAIIICEGYSTQNREGLLKHSCVYCFVFLIRLRKSILDVFFFNYIYELEFSSVELLSHPGQGLAEVSGRRFASHPANDPQVGLKLQNSLHAQRDEHNQVNPKAHLVLRFSTLGVRGSKNLSSSPASQR